MIADYPHFLRLARRLQWDERSIALDADAAAFASGALPRSIREPLRRLVGGFVVGERSVAAELEPFAAAATEAAAACFSAQAGDEARHARFFERVRLEVIGCDDPRAEVDRRFLSLFEQQLPRTARALAAGDEQLGRAVGLYHMVLEGAVFSAGLGAVLRALDGAPSLPGMRTGAELVLRDERWHIGFGVRCLIDQRVDPEALEALLGEGEQALEAWGDALDPETAGHARATHRRRVAALLTESRRTTA